MWGVIALNCEYHATKIHLSKHKPPCFTKTFTTFALSLPQDHSSSAAREWCPGRIGLHLRGLRPILATRNGTATPSYKKHSSIAPNP